MLADGEMLPVFIKNSACHKRLESSVTYIKPFLSKALQANDLLSGNDPEEGWGSRYLGNPRSLALFLPKESIKNTPSSAEVPQLSRPLVIININSDIVGSSIVADSLSKKTFVHF